MTHLITKPGQRLAKLQKILTGHKTYTLPSSEGDIFAALNVKRDELSSLEAKGEDYRLVDVETPFILASKKLKDEPTIIELPWGGRIGSNKLAVIAGPCSIESEEQLLNTAIAIKAAGATVLRGGAFKPRSCPYSFQGMGEAGLKLLKSIGEKVKLPVVTEIMDTEDISLIREYTDIIQIGARNCQNFSLLKKIGKTDKPVLLKRGLSCTIEELLLSAEYILSGGNMNVILCERGIRTFERATRSTLDISAIPVLKQTTHLPVLVDPSHAAGHWKLIGPLAKAAVAAGADGLMIEVHPAPERAMCDGKQSLRPGKFAALLEDLGVLADVMGRRM